MTQEFAVGHPSSWNKSLSNLPPEPLSLSASLQYMLEDYFVQSSIN